MRKFWLWAALMTAACNGKLTVADRSGGESAAGAGSANQARDPAGDPPMVPVGLQGGSGVALGIAGAYTGSAASAGISGSAGTSGSAATNTGSGGVIAGTMPSAAPGPGDLGQGCIPGGLVTEAVGSPAKATIETLLRCNEGLACDVLGECAPAPDCPSIGVCVIARAALGTGGVGGAPGRSVPPAGGPVAMDPGALPRTELKTGVVAMAADDSHVYWLEYGTRSESGKYQNDGTLLSYSISDGVTTKVTSGLLGPIALGLTSSHAYVYIDGAERIGDPIIPELTRVSLTLGHAALVVQEGTRPGPFTSVGSQAFWATEDHLYSMASETDALAMPFLETTSNALTSDGTDLYYAAGDVVMRSPIAGAAASPVGVTADEFALHDDGIFSLEAVTYGGLLSRAPKSGGVFQRVRALGAGFPLHLKVVGDRYFVDVAAYAVPGSGDGPQMQVLTATFAGTDPPTRLLERLYRDSAVDQLWVGTADALYWSDGQAIYRQPLPKP